MVTPKGTWVVEWRELHVGYIHDVYIALVRREIRPSAHWITEFLPRSATIVLAEPYLPGGMEYALAWDEECGWRFGVFVQGDARCPTLLKWQTCMCGDVLPDPGEVADTVRFLAERSHGRRRLRRRTRQAWSMPPLYRSYRDVDDGFDERLRGHLPPDDPESSM
ncbi:DUF6292 family protein [Thermoactinospora rubra]|uniref:DUF6292 family protein n=1 Tax=Thermoactinospora rubra TaxID=1088767 RepID=UPI0011809697|nr:DUF6292 family protein [Thermoactinospora rubra]